jgi:hypothetical protein
MDRDNFKSDEEYYFYHYCCELKENGYIKNVEYQKTKWVLLDKVLATTVKGKNRTLLRELTYTADYTIEWEDKGIELLCSEVDTYDHNKFFIHSNGISEVDTKGTFSSNNSDITFPIVQKILYSIHGVYVNKIVPMSTKKKAGLLEKTFTPNVLISKVHKVTGKKLKPKWDYKDIYEYINE